MKTNWNNVAPWYDAYLKGDDTYQAKVIAPNLLRLIAPTPGLTILDVACGQGYFSKLCAAAGAQVVGVDAADELIALAKEAAGPNETYFVGDAEELEVKGEFDVIFSVLALENIKGIPKMISGIKKHLSKNGRVVFVLLHPSFRIPKHSDWGFDTRSQTQYRKVSKYLSEVAIPIELAPFKGKERITTTTFHRSLQWYMKVFRGAGFAITNIEEWISHKKSQPGAKQKAEDAARKEFPLFLALELKQVS